MIRNMEMIEDKVLKKECVELQLSEMDMIESMYSNAGEFVMDDQSTVADLRNFLNGKECSWPFNKLEYSINLTVDEKIFEVCCTFPQDYPVTHPEIYVRCATLTRDTQHQLNVELGLFINFIDSGELCIGPVLQWLTENSQFYEHTLPTEKCQAQSQSTTCFKRFWIYSHHIYNKGKRKTILDLSKELDITGFCMSGKPGLICAEGVGDNCEEFWSRVKCMSWKKITCKQMESFETDNLVIGEMRKFDTFNEIGFENMGEFFKYLELHNCSYAFKNYFGVGENR